MKKIILFLLILSLILTFGCKEEENSSEVLSMLEEFLNEGKQSGSLGSLEKPLSWHIREVTVDKLNSQALGQVEVYTDENLYLLTFDYRMQDREWRLLYVGKDERLGFSDLQNPYRYRIRRFLYSSSFCFR